MCVEPASVVTGSWLVVLGQHSPLVDVLSGRLGNKLGSHLCELGHHVMTLLMHGEIDENAVARAKKLHAAMDVFDKYPSEAEFVLDAFALVAKASGAYSAAYLGDAINALGVAHGMGVRANNTLAVRADRACKTLGRLKAGEGIKGAQGVELVAGVLATTAMRRALNVPTRVGPGDFAGACASLIQKVKDASHGHEVKSILDVAAAQLRARM